MTQTLKVRKCHICSAPVQAFGRWERHSSNKLIFNHQFIVQMWPSCIDLLWSLILRNGSSLEDLAAATNHNKQHVSALLSRIRREARPLRIIREPGSFYRVGIEA